MDTVIIWPLLVLSILTGVKCQESFACDSEIYCHGPLLRAVQSARLYPDSKTFVDMPMKRDPEDVLAGFAELQKQHGADVEQFEALKKFVDDNFSPAGNELDACEPLDWVERPPLFASIQDSALQSWAYELNDLWKKLCRKVKKDVEDFPARHSLVYVPHPFIVPGDRFREFYYWDTWWVVRGLLLSNMTTTAKDMIDNLLYMVKEYGLVPNGGRVYYLGRSQPPLLTQMVYAYYKHTGDLDYVRDNIELLEKEYTFWIENRSITVSDSSGVDHLMTRYHVTLTAPRPEGYVEDVEATRDAMDHDSRSVLFSALASAAESGWDFSSRWFTDHRTLGTIHTPDIVPVDLNVMMQQNEYILSEFYQQLEDLKKADQFSEAASKRSAAIEALMWHKERGVWCDFDVTKNANKQECLFYPSNIFPLLMRGAVWKESEKEIKVQAVLRYLKEEGILEYPGGIPTSLRNDTGQQWDFPNAWAPLVHLFIEALDSTGNDSARDVAFQVAQKWIYNNWLAWKKTGQMFEKYNVQNPGQAGGGGEYTTQTGFGWSNAVLLILMDKYPDRLHLPRTGFSTEAIVCMAFVGVLVFLIVLGVISHAHKKYTRRRKMPTSSAFSVSEHSNAVYHPVTEPIVKHPTAVANPNVAFR